MKHLSSLSLWVGTLTLACTAAQGRSALPLFFVPVHGAGGGLVSYSLRTPEFVAHLEPALARFEFRRG